MEILHLEPTELTPRVIFDPEDLQITIQGASVPKNTESFYKPLIKWLESYSTQLPATSIPLSVDVKLKHYNSASWVYISQIFQIIGRMHEAGLRVLIDWYINTDDDYLREVGQELSEVSGIPFNYIEE